MKQEDFYQKTHQVKDGTTMVKKKLFQESVLRDGILGDFLEREQNIKIKLTLVSLLAGQ